MSAKQPADVSLGHSETIGRKAASQKFSFRELTRRGQKTDISASSRETSAVDGESNRSLNLIATGAKPQCMPCARAKAPTYAVRPCPGPRVIRFSAVRAGRADGGT